MIDEQLERMRLENELREARRRANDNARGTRFVVFLAIWLTPLLTISLFDGKEGRATTLWAFGVPIAFAVYCHLNKIPHD